MSDVEKPQGLLQSAGWQLAGQAQQKANPETQHSEKAAVKSAADGQYSVADYAVVAEPEVKSVSAAETTTQLSALTLMLLGIFCGIYLLYSFGWYLVASQYNQINQLTAVAGGNIWLFLQTVVFWVAPLAPATWFALCLKFVHKISKLSFVLFIGIVLLVPLPLFIPGGL